MSNARYPVFSRQPLSKTMRTEPFQIFSLRMREHILRQNPGLKFPEVTSLLSTLWQSLSSDEKQEYVDLAYIATDERRTARKRRPRAKPGDVSPPRAPKSDLSEPAIPDKHVTLSECPHFSIIPRGSFGTLAATASHHIIFTGHGLLDQLVDPGNPRLVN
jgi:hypothetical protein